MMPSAFRCYAQPFQLVGTYGDLLRSSTTTTTTVEQQDAQYTMQRGGAAWRKWNIRYTSKCAFRAPGLAKLQQNIS